MHVNPCVRTIVAARQGVMSFAPSVVWGRASGALERCGKAYGAYCHQGGAQREPGERASGDGEYAR